jgi:hypothetical protein
MDPRAGLDTVMKRKVQPSQELNPGHPGHSLVTVLTELPHLLCESITP